MKYPKDPTRDEMLAFLTDRAAQYGDVDSEFDIEGAMYWFGVHWHGGQDSNLYSAVSTSPYNPGPCCTGPEPDSLEQFLYQELECEYAGVPIPDDNILEG